MAVASQMLQHKELATACMTRALSNTVSICNSSQDFGSDSAVDRGTSCSAPAFGAIIALVNDARLKAHMPPMGFLNPWIYTAGPYVLNDIAKGKSTGCDGHARFNGPANGSPVVPGASWNATKG
jgi:tripeptidyl-peptidase I